MNQKIKLDTYLSVVVNNICNLTCSHCGGLACYDFTGNFAWKDSAERWEKWAEYLDTDEIAFAGGEMFLHPNLDEWFLNMRRLWPNAHIEIPTNSEGQINFPDSLPKLGEKPALLRKTTIFRHSLGGGRLFCLLRYTLLLSSIIPSQASMRGVLTAWRRWEFEISWRRGLGAGRPGGVWSIFRLHSAILGRLVPQ
jgi:hypothetical protein